MTKDVIKINKFNRNFILNFKFLLKVFQRLNRDIKTFGTKYIFFKLVLTLFNSYRIKGNFLSFKETFEYIKNTNKSIIRLGDGEILLLMGKSIPYQRADYELEQDLYKIISNYNENSPYLLCIPNHIIQATNKKLKQFNILNLWLPFKIFYMFLFPKKNIYGNAILFRFLDFFSYNIKFVYENKYIIFVANEKIFNIANLKTSKEIIKIIPKTPKNSYFEKDEIMNLIFKNMNKFEKSEVVILLSCGPLAKVLAYEISNLGYRALDLGFMFEMEQHPNHIKILLEFFKKM